MYGCAFWTNTLTPRVSLPPAVAITRGGLITAMVIFAILFLTAAIFAIYFNANMRAAEVRVEAGTINRFAYAIAMLAPQP